MGVGAKLMRRLLTPTGRSASDRYLCGPIGMCMREAHIVKHFPWLYSAYSGYHSDHQSAVTADHSKDPHLGAQGTQAADNGLHPSTLLTADGSKDPHLGAQATQFMDHQFDPSKNFSAAGSLDEGHAELATPLFARMSDAESSGAHLYALLHAPVDAAISILDCVHGLTGMPWWLTILTSTVGLRAMLFPLTVKQLKKAAQLARLRANLPSFLPPRGTGISLLEQYRLFTKKRQELGAPSPGWLIVVPLVQIPIFISWILAVRQMALTQHPGFDVGGAFWFVDLTLPVQGALGAVFPLMVAGTHFMNLQMSFSGVEEQNGTFATVMKFFKWSLEAATIPMFLISFYLPQGVFMYWVPNNILTLAQTVALQHPSIRQQLGLPQLSKQRAGRLPFVVNEGSASSSSAALDSELLVQAASCAAQGQREEAIHLLKQAVIRDPNLAEAYNALGKLHIEKQQWAAAMTFYDSAIAKAKDDGLRIAAHFGAGIALYHQDKKEEAMEALRSVAVLELPDEPHSRRRYLKALVTLGSVLHEHGRKEEALQVLKRAALHDNMIDRLYVAKLEKERDDGTSGTETIVKEEK